MEARLVPSALLLKVDVDLLKVGVPQFWLRKPERKLEVEDGELGI